MQYDFNLDMGSLNSNSVIIRNIQPNSTILEIGCAYGRMTKYLKEKLNCKIDIVEINARAGRVAAQYADMDCTGVKYGDIERRAYKNLLRRRKYNYIIFADVLEHLFNPEKVLFEIQNYLGPNGQIWISVPNIGHNSVLIDLLNDKFEYRDLGLLDKTHVKLFTESSLEKMINSVGLKIFRKENLINVVENTEFNNKYSDLPNNISSFLKNRKNGEVYQFVWGLVQ